jgi:trehalose 6-phosphate phosphatase
VTRAGVDRIWHTFFRLWQQGTKVLLKAFRLAPFAGQALGGAGVCSTLHARLAWTGDNVLDSAITLQKPPALDVGKHALFLDLDGTLVDIAARPEDVVAGDALRRLLRSLSSKMTGAIALLTGRTIESAEAVLGGAIDTIAGLHGFECRVGGRTVRAVDDLEAVRAALGDAQRLAEAGDLKARIEDKGAGLALHCRETPEHCASTRRAAEALAEQHGLTILEGKMVVELTLGVRTKGDALASFMAEPPFNGRVPIAIGDDVTDEDAFEAARTQGGFGIFVGAPLETHAHFVLANAGAVSAWLNAGLAR